MNVLKYEKSSTIITDLPEEVDVHKAYKVLAAVLGTYGRIENQTIILKGKYTPDMIERRIHENISEISN
ncbi:MAG: hypothetical protein EOP45_17115 [Sphingobacteriaceae bacterium]|nr:MAG: hypothetical protein EOP45_17115 [Sphingobacteriaceae bacterium]